MNLPTTPEERHTAALCHLVSIPFPFFGPIAFLALNRKSKFVALHAAQALFEALVLSTVLFIAGAISLAFSLRKIWEVVQSRGESLTWSLVMETLLKAGATWVILGLISGYYLISSILDANQARQGRWKSSIISGRLAKRFVRLTDRERTTLGERA